MMAEQASSAKRTEVAWRQYIILIHNNGAASSWRFGWIQMYLSFMFLYSVCIFYSSCSSTSFGVNGTWVRVVFVAIFAISIDPPRLTKSLRTRLNQARARQEVVPLVTIVVTTETTSLPGPSRSQLREGEESLVLLPMFPRALNSLHLKCFHLQKDTTTAVPVQTQVVSEPQANRRVHGSLNM